MKIMQVIFSGEVPNKIANQIQEKGYKDEFEKDFYEIVTKDGKSYKLKERKVKIIEKNK